MRAAIAALAIVLCAASPARAADELRYEPWPHAAITTAIGLATAGEVALRHDLAPRSCTHCGGNAYDRSITESLAWRNHALASTLSDVGLVLLPAGALIYGFAADGGDEGAIDALVFGETFAVNFLVTEALKYAFARERPMVIYLGKEDPKVAGRPDDWYVSFPSGHASSSFVSVAALATIADLRGRDPAPIWLIGLPVAAGVSYLRVAGLHHWTTDVLAGAALGTILGVGLPRLLHGPGGLGGDDDGDDRRAAEATPLQVLQLGGRF